MVRRSLVLILILNLVALVPLPASACALLSGLDGPCQCSMPANCQPMLATQSADSGPAISCHCILSGFPFPEALQSTANPMPAFLATSFVSPIVPNAQSSFARPRATLAVSQLGPPGGRAGLCVFLI